MIFRVELTFKILKNLNEQRYHEIKFLPIVSSIHFLFHRHSVFHGKVYNYFLFLSNLNFINIFYSDVTKLPPPSNKRYVSSFKTLVHSTNLKQTQRLNYVNDSVMILKLSKDSKREKQTSSFNYILN